MHDSRSPLPRTPTTTYATGHRAPARRHAARWLPWSAYALAALIHLPAAAQVPVLDIAVTTGTTPSAVLTPWGVLVHPEAAAGSQAVLACADLYGPATWLLDTGDDGLLLAGEQGPWATTQLGCHWRRTTGDADDRRVVGVHQTQPSTGTVVFAIDDPGVLLSAVVTTSDGGLTSHVAGGLSLGESRLIGLVGRDEDVEAVGIDAAGHLLRWRSDDGGGTFVAGPVDTAAVHADQVAVAAVAEDTLWLWEGGRLLALDRSSGAVAADRDFGTAGPVAVTSSGDLLVAAGADGLWRRAGSGAWAQVQVAATTAVAAAGATLWIGREVTGAGEPMVLASTDGGDTWASVFEAPTTWAYPAGCETSTAQLCSEQAFGLAAALGVAPPGGGAGPGGAGQGDAGSGAPQDASAGGGGCAATGDPNRPGGAAWPAWIALFALLAVRFAGRRDRHRSP